MLKMKHSARLTQLRVMLKDDVSDQLMATPVDLYQQLETTCASV